MYSEQEKYDLAIERGIIVDEQDEWLLRKFVWCLSGNKDKQYAITEKVFDGVKCRMFLHHTIMGYPIYQYDVIDHIDRNRLNNKRNNLRLISHQENNRNSDRVDLSGVYYNEQDNRYRVRLSFGSYSTREEAMKVSEYIRELVKNGQEIEGVKS